MVDGLEGDLVSFQQDPAGVGRLKATEDLQQRGLSRAVVADQPEYLAAPQPQAHVDQCGEGAEPLAHMLDPQNIGVLALRCRRELGRMPGHRTLPWPRSLASWTLAIIAIRMAAPK
jgi:hypothetical protein